MKVSRSNFVGNALRITNTSVLTDHLFDIFIGILQPTIKKLVTVTEMLSKHKQKYMEMIR